MVVVLQPVSSTSGNGRLLWLIAIVLVPYPSNPDFVGRSSVLEQLKEQLGPAEVTSSTAQARVSLYGLGGIG